MIVRYIPITTVTNNVSNLTTLYLITRINVLVEAVFFMTSAGALGSVVATDMVAPHTIREWRVDIRTQKPGKYAKKKIRFLWFFLTHIWCRIFFMLPSFEEERLG
jgi:uncharacterized membrane protein YwaF